MKLIRIIALGLMGAVVARQIQQHRTEQSGASLANQPDHLLPARTRRASSPREGAVASAGTNLPDYTPESTAPAQRQPPNTPPEQQITGAQWTSNTDTTR